MNNNNYYPSWNPIEQLIPYQKILNTPISTLNLTQIQDFNPIKRFTDSANTEWSLVKASTDSTIDIPNPKDIQIVDYWNHEFPNLKNKIYIYVVEGIKQPRVEIEQPTKILYQWFSTVWVASFNPNMISPKEWLKANVYAAPITDTRVSKLKALCYVQSYEEHDNSNNLIQSDEVNGRINNNNQESNQQ